MGAIKDRLAAAFGLCWHVDGDPCLLQVESEISNVAVSTQTDTSYTFAATDAATYVRFNNASAISATVPPASLVPFAIGAQITVEQQGAGTLTLVAGAGVTINSPSTLALAHQFAVATLIKVGNNEWTLAGNVA